MSISPRPILRRTLLLGASATAAAALFRHRDYLEYLVRPRLPGEDEYRAFLAEIPLRYLTVSEIIRPHRNVRNGVPNTLPPRHLWNNLPPALLAADEIRHRLGVPLDCINSAFRCPAYNAECSGAASKSYHLSNKALDLMFRCSAEKAATVARQIRNEGFFTGGIGIYPTFIHVDTRGRNANWG